MGREDHGDSQKLAERLPLTQEESPPFNLDHFYDTLEKISGEASPGERENPRQKSRGGDTVDAFLAANYRRPGTDLLCRANEEGDLERLRKYLSQISADDWRVFLIAVSRSNRRVVFACLAKAGCMKFIAIAPEDLAPIVQDGITAAEPTKKCGAIAETVKEKLIAPGARDGTRMMGADARNRQKDGPPLPPFVEQLSEDQTKVREVEITKAVAGLPA